MKDPILVEWGKRIVRTRLLRNAKGDIRRPGQEPMSQGELAELCEVSQATVSRWESGLIEPTRRHKAALAYHLGSPIDALFPNDLSVAA